jgi:hypothetical protein
MGAVASTNHLLNFAAPAFFLAVGMVLYARVFRLNQASGFSWKAQIAINFIVGCAVLAAGMWWFGRDGKMASYAALVLSSALCQWVLSRGWR